MLSPEGRKMSCVVHEIKHARVFQFLLGALIVSVPVAILTNQSLLEFGGVYALSLGLALILAWPLGFLDPFWPRLRR